MNRINPFLFSQVTLFQVFLSTDSWFQVKNSAVFHLQVTVAKPKILPVSLKLQAHLKDWTDFNSNLADPEAWSETLNGSEFYMYSAFIAVIWSGSRHTASPRNYVIALFLILVEYIPKMPVLKGKTLSTLGRFLDWYFLSGASRRLCSRFYCALWITFLLSTDQMHGYRWNISCTCGTRPTRVVGWSCTMMK